MCGTPGGLYDVQVSIRMSIFSGGKLFNSHDRLNFLVDFGLVSFPVHNRSNLVVCMRQDIFVDDSIENVSNGAKSRLTSACKL